MSDLYLMSPVEVARGYLIGHAGELPPAADERLSPREALENVIRIALERAPCGVAFSGGRDSSVVLALAAHVARRDGLPEPIPLTRVFPGVAEADEREWQETVLRHIGLQDWQQIEIHDELDVVGPLAARHLVEHGLVWPPTIAGDVPLVSAVPGGTVIDGEGGDEVLGVGAHRVEPFTRLVRSPRPFRWRRVRRALGAAAPPMVRRRYVTRRWADMPITWLRPDARQELLAAVTEDEVSDPFSFAASVRRVPRRRTQVLGRQNRRILAEQAGVDLWSPLLQPEVVHALARDGGVIGRGDRTTVLRALVPDLLPDHLLSRTSKATFNTCYMASHTKAFAQRWNGTGVDDSLVDAEELRRIWLTGETNALTEALLQQAWLADRAQ